MQQTKVRGEGKLGREEPLSQQHNLLPNPLGLRHFQGTGPWGPVKQHEWEREGSGSLLPRLRQDVTALLPYPTPPFLINRPHLTVF